MKIVIAAGGTGGHFYPALALYQQLKKLNHEVFFIVKLNSSIEKLMQKEKIRFQEISCAPFFGQSPFTVFSGTLKTLRGINQSVQIIKTFSPDGVVAFGSYLSVPPVLAAFYCQVPIVLHEQNITPGWANRFCSLFARKVAVSFPETQSYFKTKAVLTGNLVRESFLGKSHQEARQNLGLAEEKFTVLIFGGSAGAKQLNQWTLNSVEKFKELAETIQFVHISGNPEDSELLRKKYADCGFKATVLDYAHQMEHCYSAADLAICRAGATTVSELILTQTPAILVPYPYAVGKHQEKNANYLERMGAVGVIEESPDFAQQLSEQLKKLIQNREQLKRMKEAYLTFPVKLSESAARFVSLIENELCIH